MPAYTLRQLECFLAVADHGTFATAAEKLHVTATAVSAAIDVLERLAGEPLTVRRRAHGVTLTSAGRDLVPRARALLTAADDLAPRRDGLQGRLSVGCYSSLAATLIPGLVEGFEAEHLQVQVEFMEGSQDDLLAALADGRIDAAILYDRDLRGPVATAVLDVMSPHVLVSADHRFAGASRVHLIDLADEPFIQFDVQPAWQNTRVIMAQAGVQPNVRFVTTNIELARSLVGRGMGYAVFVHRPHTDLTHEGRRVAVVEIDPTPPSVNTVLAWKPGPTSAILNAFIEWAPEQVRALRRAGAGA